MSANNNGSRTFIVCFWPAKREKNGTYSVTMAMYAPWPVEHEVTVATLAALEKEFRPLALEYGQTCLPWIKLKDPHDGNFVGYDAWKKKVGHIDVPARPEREVRSW
jgi:hypothetical protein